jgi:hypothetical protein
MMRIKVNKQTLLNTSLLLLLIVILISAYFVIFELSNYRKAASVIPREAPFEEEPEMDSFENETEGYKFDYPKGWKAELRQGKVVLQSDLGSIIVALDNNELKLGYEPKDFEYAANLEKIGEKIKNTFELTDAEGINKDYIRQRYMETVASDSARN